MKKKVISIILLIFAVLFLFSCKKEEKIVYSGAVMIYTSLSEDEIKKLKVDFENKYKGIVLDYFYGSVDTINHMIEDEIDLGQIETDVLFFGNEQDMINLVNKDALKKYSPNNLKEKNNDYYTNINVSDNNSINLALVNNALNETNGKYLIDFIVDYYK